MPILEGPSQAGALPGPVTQVGKYQILDQVGEGAMGVVYRATDPVLNRIVAVKVMNEGLAQDEALRERFLREAQAAGSLQHPNVVTIYDFGETDGHLYIAMEYVQGADLEHLLKHNAPLSLAAQLELIIDVLNGLSYAHRRGIVHRDIKPANIRVDEEGHARIMDFGIAHLASSNLTKSGVMMGTPNYMAPEQITGESLTPSVDLFSVGAVLYELLTHQRPFQGDTMHSVLFQIVSDSPPDPISIKPDLPPALNELVMKSLAKHPGERFHSAAEMANALTAIRATMGASRVSNTVSQRVSIEKSLREQRELQEHAIADARRWRLVGGVSVTLLAGAVGFLLARPGPASSPPAPVTPAVATARDVRTDTSVARPSGAADSTNASRTAAADAITRPTPPVARATESATKQPAQRAEAPRRVATLPPPAPRQSETRTSATPTTDLRANESTSTVAADSVKRRLADDSARAAQSAPQQSAPVTPTGPAPNPQVSAPAIVAPPKEPENPNSAIANVIAAYGRAIGTRQVAEVRRVYVGMTSQQRTAWESFFSSVRSMNASFEIAALDVSGSTAVARLTGLYQWVTRSGRPERQPVSFEAMLQREGDRWTLQAVR